MTSMYPSSLSYFVNRISNYTQNTVKILPYRTTDVPSSQVVVVDLPTNALIDLRTFAWHFGLSTSTTAAAGSGTNFAQPPQNIESIIDKVVIEINGQSLNSSANQNYVFNALLPLMGGTDLVNKRKIYQNGGSQPGAVPTANVLVPQRFVISHWLGFLGSVMPDVIDTSALGHVRISIHLANSRVLISSNPVIGTSEDYSLNDLYFTMNTLSIDDGVFYPLHSTYLRSGSIYEMPFDNYYTSLFSTASWDNTLRFSLGSQSIDWIGAIAPTNYNKRSSVAVDGGGNALSGRGAMFDSSLVGCANYSFVVNAVSYPQFKAKPDEVFTHTMNALQQTHDVTNGISPLITSATVFKTYYALFLQAFALAANDNERVISGINTLGECCQLSFETSGDGTTTGVPGYVILLAKTTSILRVGDNRSLEIVP